MGLVYRTSMWADHLWSEHLEVSEAGRALVKEGIEKQGEPFAGFPADLHARLYLPRDPDEQPDYPEWAGKLHGMSTELGEWAQLKLMTARNGFASGIAAEVMLDKLLPHVPDPPEAEPSACSGEGSPPSFRNPSPSHGLSSSNGDDPGGTSSRRGLSESSNSCPSSAGGEASSPDRPSDSDIRAAIRKAAREARDAVQDAESALEGLGPCMPGNQFVQKSGPADLKAIREAHQKLKDSPRLRKIAQLAGRLERLATAKARSKVKPGTGELHGVGLGDDLSRLLPSELVQLRHPRLRLSLLARLVEHRALTYAMQGREPMAKGPVIVLLDESASMRNEGRDIWSKAVALALLSTATKQKRAFHLIAFNARIRREVAIEPGKATPTDIARALDMNCAGGTDFDQPILRSVDIINTSRTMKNADVVIITDGEDELEPETVEAATRLTREEGVSFFVVGVGFRAADTVQISLGAIATEMVRIDRMNGISGIRSKDGIYDVKTELVAPVINLERRTA